MGIQDRDYYWKKHKEASKANNRDSFDSLLNKTPHRYRQKSWADSSIRFLLYPALMMGMLWYGADAFLKYQASNKQPTLQPIISRPPPTPAISLIRAKPDAIQPISGGIVLKADRQGHFRGTVLINNVPMPFLIDTGATKTVIPAKMAASAKLPYGRYVQANTAGGKVAERETVIDTMRLGNSVIQNLDAHTNEHLDEVLIGMNTLKYFRIMQDGKTMTLVANSQSANKLAQAPMPYETAPIAPLPSQDTVASNRPIKKPITIKKTVTCDSRQVCTTKYSDH